MKHINIITLGCSKNLVDSERISGQLQKDSFKVSHNADGPADIVIINTCGFIHDAKEESIDTILRYTQAKKQGLVKEVIVTGCLAQRYKDELKAEIPEADAWFGVEEPHGLFEHLRKTYSSENTDRVLATPNHYAFLKIAEGCDRTCSFCAIPMIRGRFISRTPESLEEEARKLVAGGVKELLLIAQDLSYYGYDLQKRPMLADLLKRLVKIDGLHWIRLHYAYPQKFPKEVIDLMASEPKICKYLDIPVQHINDAVLKAMRRNTTKEETLNLIHEFRVKIPDVALRTTLLVGFPGETQTQFNELLAFVEQTRFDRLGVFTYSAEEGTRAWELKDTVSEKVKQARARKIMEVQQNISLELNEARIGKLLNVLIDREEDQYFVGRTEYDSPEVDNEVFITKEDGVEVGSFSTVKIESASEFELFGKISK